MIKKLFLTASVFLLFLFSAQATYAAFWDDLLGGAKKIVAPAATNVTVDAAIALAPSGDLDKNNQIDAGDTIVFTYKINNPTDKDYPFGLLKTNIPRKRINFIHQIEGAMSLQDKKDTIEIPNIHLKPFEELTISFRARVNYFDTGDVAIWTEPEFLTQDKKSLHKAAKKEIKAKAWKKGKMPSSVSIKKL